MPAIQPRTIARMARSKERVRRSGPCPRSSREPIARMARSYASVVEVGVDDVLAREQVVCQARVQGA